MRNFLTWPDLTLPPINLWSVPRMQSKVSKVDVWNGHLEDPYPIATGVKFDEEKIPLDLLDPLALEGLAKVLQFGAKKYADRKSTRLNSSHHSISYAVFCL